MNNNTITILVRTSTHYDWAWKKKYTSMTVFAFDTVKEAQETMYKQREEDYGTSIPQKLTARKLNDKRMIKPSDSFEDEWQIYTVPKNHIGKDIYVNSIQL